jgi:hypothetical protein
MLVGMTVHGTVGVGVLVRMPGAHGVGMHVIALMAVPVAVDRPFGMGVLVGVARAGLVMRVGMLALVRMVVAVPGTVRVRVLVSVAVVMVRVLALVNMRVDVRGAVGMPMLVGVRAVAFDPGLAFAATAGGTHDSFL